MIIYVGYKLLEHAVCGMERHYVGAELRRRRSAANEKAGSQAKSSCGSLEEQVISSSCVFGGGSCGYSGLIP